MRFSVADRTLNRQRNRMATQREMPVVYEFSDHLLEPRFTMHKRGELSVSIQDGDQRRHVGTIVAADRVFYSSSAGEVDQATRDDLLALGKSIYQTLLTKFEAKQR